METIYRERFVLLLILIFFLSSRSLTGQDFRAGDQDLLFMPTAETMPKGSICFSNYELLYLNLTVALTPSTHLGVGSLFPITSDFTEAVSINIKQQVFNKGKIKISAWALIFPAIKGILAGGITSIGGNKTNLHLGLGVVGSIDYMDAWEDLIFMVGFRHRISHKTSLMAEYYNQFEGFSSGGLVMLGFRFQSKKMAFDLGGFRGVTDNVDDLLLFPYLKITILIK